jgi:hypothetical protein
MLNIKTETNHVNRFVTNAQTATDKGYCKAIFFKEAA